MTLAKNRRPTRLLASLLLAVLVAPFGTTAAQPQTAPDKQTAPGKAMAASSVHEVPFGADGNALRLTVANATGARAPTVEVVLVEAPAWIEGMPAQTALGALGERAEAAARLPFDVARAAPVSEVATLRFSIRPAGTVIAEKQVRLQVAPPKAMRLRGNYPNPSRGRRPWGTNCPRPPRCALRCMTCWGGGWLFLIEGFNRRAFGSFGGRRGGRPAACTSTAWLPTSNRATGSSGTAA